MLARSLAASCSFSERIRGFGGVAFAFKAIFLGRIGFGTIFFECGGAADEPIVL